MLRLLIVRHAKAVASDGRGDFARALAERGRADAKRIGAWIAERKTAPDFVVHSGAARTRETAAVLVEQWSGPVAIAEDPGLYDASAGELLKWVRRVPDGRTRLAIVGHNPAVGELACLLTGSGSPAERRRMAAKFPTGAVAVVDFATGRWREIAPGLGALAHFVTPGELAAADD